MKFSENNKNDKPKPETDTNDPKKEEKNLSKKSKEEEEGSFGEWCKNHPVKAIGWIFFCLHSSSPIIRIIILEVKQQKSKGILAI